MIKSVMKMLVGVLFCANCLAQAQSQPNVSPGDPVIAKVLDKEIRLSQESQFDAIIFSTLLDRYAEEEGVVVSQEEIDSYIAATVPESPLAARGPEERRVMTEVLSEFVKIRKINLSLFRKYGGRVIFQQMGPEPIDAYRDFLKEQEQKGSFVILDKRFEARFWRYFTSLRHSVISNTREEGDKILRTPIWQRD